MRLYIVLLGLLLSLDSCSGVDLLVPDFILVHGDSLEVTVELFPGDKRTDGVFISEYAPLGLSHQSAAVYQDYAVFVTPGRGQMLLYNLRERERVYALELPRVGGTTYHCNQSSFGVDKYDPSDPFPLLYISQRAKSNGRCFVEVFRLFPVWNDEISEYESFRAEMVQIIHFPVMTSENALGNVNCTIDTVQRCMYTYSRNNNASDDNYGMCKISRFAIPDIYKSVTVLEDDAILSSFMIDISASNMQGGCIEDGLLYIGQGMASVGYIYLNIVDLEKQELIQRIDLLNHGVGWEPQGCFFYDGSVMLTHSSAISRIER